MSAVRLDLNSLPEEGRPPDVFEYKGMLSKDGILVSPVAVKNLPMRLPFHLNFSKIEHAALHPIESLPAFELHPLNPSPNPSVPDRRLEWLKFLKYLHERDKVVPITVDGWELFIKPPKILPSEKSPVRVCYRRLHNNRAFAQPVPPGPVQHMAPAARQSANGGAQLPVHPVQPGPGPETGRPRAEVLDPAWTEKVQEKPVMSIPRRLGQMHPSYLQTLAQLHASWQFGGLAELVDNARDAHASR